MKCRKTFSFSLFSILLFSVFIVSNFAQTRQRVINAEKENQPTQPTITIIQPASPTRNPISRPVLTNEIRVVTNNPSPAPLVKKTVSSTPTNSAAINYASNQSLAIFNKRLMSSMQSKIGIPYRYGSDGPNSYDCSGLVWSVFSTAGLPFTRTSAGSYFKSFEPVYGDERYKFGTLVFFNGLGHVGIVIDENTFFHASSSKGVTFSPLAGYWSKRIVGYRRIPTNFN
ncbi:MAG: C40 family peptidase [Acidobacteriota bacterium]